MRRSSWYIAWIAMVAGCGTGLQNELHPTGSSTLAAVDGGSALITVNTFEGSISRKNLDPHFVRTRQVEFEPTRVAPFGDVVLVTLRGARQVAVVDQADLAILQTLPTGAEPFGIVADEKAQNFWVAESQSGRVVEYDRDFEATRSWKVDGEPRWLALHPSREALFVVGSRDASLTRIDLETGAQQAWSTPSIGRPSTAGPRIPMQARFTGDPAITPDGGALVVPGLYVDNTTPVIKPPEDLEPDEPFETGYGSRELVRPDPWVIERMNPAVTVFPLDRHGDLDLDAEFSPHAVFVGSLIDRTTMARSYPSSVTADPSGGQVYVSMEASDAVVLVNLAPFERQGTMRNRKGKKLLVQVDEGKRGILAPKEGVEPAHSGMFERPVAGWRVRPSGPDGVAFTNKNEAWVHSFIDRSVALVATEELRDAVATNATRWTFEGAGRGSTEVYKVADPLLSEELREGMRLFYSARDTQMSGGSVSCSTCHFGGRDDGLTWMFEDGPLQTPSLAGAVSRTAPVTWTSEVSSVATEAALTSRLMGGFGAGRTEIEAIALFVDYGRAVDRPTEHLDAAAVERGRQIFFREDVACGTCHSGERFTDNASHDLLGLVQVNTPSLTGVSATAPYMHDGSIADLDALMVLTNARLMGDTSMLNDAERADLVAFLEWI